MSKEVISLGLFLQQFLFCFHLLLSVDGGFYFPQMKVRKEKKGGRHVSVNRKGTLTALY